MKCSACQKFSSAYVVVLRILSWGGLRFPVAAMNEGEEREGQPNICSHRCSISKKALHLKKCRNVKRRSETKGTMSERTEQRAAVSFTCFSVSSGCCAYLSDSPCEREGLGGWGEGVRLQL